jgi:hypothetical protein
MGCAAKVRFAMDSPLEEKGFELLVPPSKKTAVRGAGIEGLARLTLLVPVPSAIAILAASKIAPTCLCV